MTTTYSTLKMARPYYDPIHQNVKTTTIKYDSHNKGKAVRSITREQGVVTVRCLASGRTVEVPWSACLGGVLAESEQPGEAEPEAPRDPLYPPTQKRERRPRSQP